jgi:LmbE family N-acetylglucosaminyl deacetylase
MIKSKKILVFAAHPDDELLGCGGTLLYFKKKGYKIKIIFLSDGETSRKINNKTKNFLINKRHDQARLVSKKCKFLDPIFKDFPDNKLDTVPFLKIIQSIEKEIKSFKPNIIFTHYENDLNIDHRIVFKGVVTATRPKSKTFVNKIYCFEIPSSTDFNFTRNKNKVFNPNYFVDIDKFIGKKIDCLKIYKSEMRKWPHPRSLKGVKNLAQYRGSQVGLKHAESFINLREIDY